MNAASDSIPSVSEKVPDGVSRLFALDFVKGVCVIAMLVHHTLNYFPLSAPVIKYARFVSGAFIFITGFLISHTYYLRLLSGAQGIYNRLLIRGLKLLLLFVILNLTTLCLLPGVKRASSLSEVNWNEWLKVLLFTGDYRVLDFDMLAAIAYVLILSPLLLLLARCSIWLSITVSMLAFACCALMDQGVPGLYYMRHVAIGMMGSALGFIPHRFIAGARRLWWPVCLVYVVHLALLPYVSLQYPVYTALVLLNVLFFYTLGLHIRDSSAPGQMLVILGRYSLFTYLWQIAVLRVLRILMPLHPDSAAQAGIAFLAATILTIAAVLLLGAARARSRLCDTAYRAVFA